MSTSGFQKVGSSEVLFPQQALIEHLLCVRIGMQWLSLGQVINLHSLLAQPLQRHQLFYSAHMVLVLSLPHGLFILAVSSAWHALPSP